MISIDIFNYADELVCPLYTSDIHSSGQASDIIITYQRNGAKTLSFTLPDKMINANGESVDKLIGNVNTKHILGNNHVSCRRNR